MAWVVAGPRLARSGLTWAVKPRFGLGFTNDSPHDIMLNVMSEVYGHPEPGLNWTAIQLRPFLCLTGGPRACPRGLASPELSQELHGLPYRVSGRGPWCLYSWDLGRDMELLGLVSASSASRAAKASIISSALVLIVVSRKRASVNSSKDVPPIPTSAMFITTPPASRERRCA